MKQKKKKKEERNQKKRKKNGRSIKDKIIKDIRALLEEEDHYQPERVSRFWNNNYIVYESNGDKNSNLLLEEYFNKIKLYLKNIIIDLQSSDTWDIQLTIATNFISSKGTKEERVMHSTSDNVKFVSYNDANEVAKELFESLRSRYQDNLETLMKESDFIFDSVQLMYHKCHKVNFKCGGLDIDSPDGIKL